jgi:para-aminobenzoate synthetase/4-amino-4-deoxychorismate lyase
MAAPPVLASRPAPERGVFETLLVWDGATLELERHLERLAASTEALYGETLPGDARTSIVEAARRMDPGRLRLTVAPRGRRGLATEVRTAAIQRSIVLPGWEHAVSLRRLVVQGGFGGHKWADRDLLAAAEASFDGAVALLVDDDGSVLEASRGNVFVVSAGALVTPPADGRILPGVTRQRVLELSSEVGLEARQGSIALEQLLEGDEVFLTGAVRGIEPVQRLEGLRSWTAGEITGVLSHELRALWLGQAGEHCDEDDQSHDDPAQARAAN